MSDQLDNNFEMNQQNELTGEEMSADDDLIMEKILDNMNNTRSARSSKKSNCAKRACHPCNATNQF